MEATTEPPESKKLTPHAHVANLHPDIAGKVTALIHESRAAETIVWRLPKRNLSAGTVLQHAVHSIEAYFEQYTPCIWKVGWTHDPIWRWGNTLYGYGVAKDRWEQMVMIFASHEPHGPAFLEAALIEKYKSFLVLFLYRIVLSRVLERYSKRNIIHSKQIVQEIPFNTGAVPGCRNIRLGGDTVKESPTSGQGDAFMTYFVDRSFRFPPSGEKRKRCKAL